MSKEATPGLNTIEASKLMSANLPSVRYVIDGLLPHGLHVLAGEPKIGKSYLTLWICTQVAQGKPIWDMQTEQCGVLYLSLEDTPGRIRKRLLQMGAETPENLHFAVQASRLDEGLLDELEGFLKAHPDVGLVVIDTLQKVRSQSSSGQGSSYSADYQALGALKALADRRQVALLLIHHLRKARSDDPFQMISGTTGITGAVDTSFVLVADTSDRKSARLYVNGRDVPYQEMDLCFMSGIWSLVERSTQTQLEDSDEPPRLIRDIVQFVYDNNGWKGTASQLLFLLQGDYVPVNVVSIYLKEGASFLSECGVDLTFKRTGKHRFIIFTVNEERKRLHLEAEALSERHLMAAVADGFELSAEEREEAGLVEGDDGDDGCDG